MTPNPGSKEAREQGCKCPVLDNGHGNGYMGIKGIYVINDNCPIHVPADGDRREQQDQPPAIREASDRDRPPLGELQSRGWVQQHACRACA